MALTFALRGPLTLARTLTAPSTLTRALCVPSASLPSLRTLRTLRPLRPLRPLRTLHPQPRRFLSNAPSQAPSPTPSTTLPSTTLPSTTLPSTTLPSTTPSTATAAAPAISLWSRIKARGPQIVLGIALGGVLLENLGQLGSIPDGNQRTLLLHYLINLQNSVVVGGLDAISEAIEISPYAARSFGLSTEVLVQVVAHLNSKVEYVTQSALEAVVNLATNVENVNDLREVGAISVLVDLAANTGDGLTLEALASLCTPINSDNDFNTCVLQYGKLTKLIPLFEKTDNPLELRSLLKILAAIAFHYERLELVHQQSLGEQLEKITNLTESEDPVLSGYSNIILARMKGEMSTDEAIALFEEVNQSVELFESQVKVSTAAGLGLAWGLLRAKIAKLPLLRTALRSSVGGALIVILDQTIYFFSYQRARDSAEDSGTSILLQKFVCQALSYIVVMTFFPYSLIPSMLPNYESIAETLETSLSRGVDI